MSDETWLLPSFTREQHRETAHQYDCTVRTVVDVKEVVGRCTICPMPRLVTVWEQLRTCCDGALSSLNGVGVVLRRCQLDVVRSMTRRPASLTRSAY